MADLSYSELASLMQDGSFRERVKVAVLSWADYVYGEDPGTPAHNNRYQYAQKTFLNSDAIAAQLQPVVVMDPVIRTNGSDVTDAELQSAVENAIFKMQ